MTDKTLFENHAEVFSSDIGMYYCGKRIASKNHTYGPEIRSHFLLVLVEKGSAVLHGEKKRIPFGDRDMLVMFPGEKIFYETLTDWSIQWIGVCGDRAEEVFAELGVTRETPIFKPAGYERLSQIMSALFDISTEGSLSAKYKIQSLLYDFFSTLLLAAPPKHAASPIASALDIIHYNYNNEINIKHLSDSLFLNSAYFSRLFKRQTGMSPKQYIRTLRLEKAKELLARTDYSVKEISITVGFPDPLYFSKLFCKTLGVTPTEYRKKQLH